MVFALLLLQAALAGCAGWSGDEDGGPAPHGASPVGVAAPEHPTGPDEPRGGAVPPRRALQEFLDPIVGRNLFNSAATAAPAVGTAAGGAVRRSELSLQLVSTSVASDPRWNSAIVREEKGAPSRFVRLGSASADWVVREIRAPWLDVAGHHRPARLVIERDGVLEFIEEDNPAPKVRKKKKRRKKTKRKRRKKRRKNRSR